MIRETMSSHPSMLPPLPRNLSVGWTVQQDTDEDESEEEDPPSTAERVILEAMWKHKGHISTLHIPFLKTFNLSTSKDRAEDKDEDDDEDDDGETVLTMKRTSRGRSLRRPSPIKVHRQTSSLGSNIFSGSKTPSVPSTPVIAEFPEEERFADAED